MAMAKRNAAGSKNAAALKTEAAATVKSEEAKKNEAEVSAEDPAKKEAVKKNKPGRKPGAAKKAAAEAKEPEAKKAPGRKPAVKCDVHIQFSGKSYSNEDLIKIAKDVWQYDLQQKESDIAELELYVKPEENLVYYVINGEYSGSFGI